MSSLKSPGRTIQDGFTLVELLVVIIVIGIVSTSVYTFINTSVSQYLALQQDSLLFGDLAMQSQRIANVLRGLTDITQATSSELTAYAYFSPNDTYVSQIHYYINGSGNKLLADVTPLTANPPNGTLITDQEKTFTIIDSYYSTNGSNLFTYLDASGNALSMPLSNLNDVKQIRITLSVPSKAPSANGSQTMSVQVSLRNRKANL